MGSMRILLSSAKLVVLYTENSSYVYCTCDVNIPAPIRIWMILRAAVRLHFSNLACFQTRLYKLSDLTTFELDLLGLSSNSSVNPCLGNFFWRRSMLLEIHL